MKQKYPFIFGKENPGIMTDESLYSHKCPVWRDLWTRRITFPVFFEDANGKVGKVNGECH